MSKIGFVPTGKTVLIETPEEKKRTAGGIIIPDSAKQETPLIGTIVAVSDFVEVNLGYKVGQKILYRRFRDHELRLSGKSYRVIEDADENIFGIFTSDED